MINAWKRRAGQGRTGIRVICNYQAVRFGRSISKIVLLCDFSASTHCLLRVHHGDGIALVGDLAPATNLPLPM